VGQTTVIPTVVIPYRVVFPNQTIFDASTDLVDGVTPVNGVVNSPIFKAVPWSAGPTASGTTQLGDAMMRANFWSTHSDQGSGYHVVLSTPLVVPTVTIVVPADKGFLAADSVSGAPFGYVDNRWLRDTMAQVTIALGIKPDTLPIHLFSTVAATSVDFFSLGFHDAWDLSGITGVAGVQTFVQAGYFSATSQFARNPNVSIVAHELAEWLNDPTADNLVPV